MRKIPRTPEYLEQVRQRRIEVKRKWRDNNPEAMQRARDNWRENNRDRILQTRRERTERITGKKVTPRRFVSDQEKRDKHRIVSARWYGRNKDKIVDKVRDRSRKYYARKGRVILSPVQNKRKLEWQKGWRSRNPVKMRQYSFKSRQKPQVLIQNRLRTRINKMLRVKGARKSYKTVELVGCSWAFLKSYIEGQFIEGMSWSNRNQWHVDHVKPCAKFDLTDPDEQKACFNFTNLQPLWAPDNMKKGAKYAE